MHRRNSTPPSVKQYSSSTKQYSSIGETVSPVQYIILAGLPLRSKVNMKSCVGETVATGKNNTECFICSNIVSKDFFVLKYSFWRRNKFYLMWPLFSPLKLLSRAFLGNNCILFCFLLLWFCSSRICEGTNVAIVKRYNFHKCIDHLR